MSIFSIISLSAAFPATVFSKGYKSTMTKSNEGISWVFISALSESTSALFKIPPNTFGWSVFTLPPKIDGYPVVFSIALTSCPRLLIKVSVPPVEYKVTLFAASFSISGSNPVLSKTEISAEVIFFESIIVLKI